MTPAEERAAREGMPVLAVIPFTLLRVAEGHPMVESLMDGTEILIRLATPDEVMEFQRSALEKLPADSRPPLMSYARAAELTKPLRSAS